MVFPIINIQDFEQKDDFPWAECPECKFNTGNRKDEMDALQFFRQLSPPDFTRSMKLVDTLIETAYEEAKALNPSAEYTDQRSKTLLARKELVTALYLIHPEMWEKPPVCDYEQVFHDFWKDIVLFQDGLPNVDQIKRELYDARVFMEEAVKVYFHVTGGRISKVTTKAEHVIEAVEDNYEDYFRDQFREELEGNIQPPKDFYTEYMRQLEAHPAFGGFIDPENYDDLENVLKEVVGQATGWVEKHIQHQFADWLWRQLMDWCKKRGYAPAEYNDLFNLVEQLRKA
jgi:hypothetical protein